MSSKRLIRSRLVRLGSGILAAVIVALFPAIA
jgi:hypothetical protein